MENTDNLLKSILYSESEGEVSNIITKNKSMNDPESWKPLDGRDTNVNIITNQSSTGAKAATELITNMVDSILIKRCLEEGMNPKDKAKVPKTMYDAVETLIKKNLQRGKIINADNQWIKTYAEKNLTIGITTTRKNSKNKEPCFTFVDNGEGQKPKKFPNTFLSLSEKYKSDIPFVQGKYNMGSSGTLGYCGEHWYKLIISRRYDQEGNWGWTLVRKSPQSEGDGIFAEYFIPSGEIPELSSNIQSVKPFKTQENKVCNNVSLRSGSIVKLYSYYMGHNYSGFNGTRAAFSENMVETILPLRLMDFTVKPSKNKGTARAQGIDIRRFCGMEFLLCRMKGDINNDEDDESNTRAEDLGSFTDPDIGKINLSAFLFREKPPQWYSNSNSRVFHHVNGQTMFKETRELLTRCKFPSLKDRIAIFVNSSELREPITIWKGDRETICSTNRGEKYKNKVKELIKSSEKLKKWNQEMKEAELESATSDIDNNIVREMIKHDPNLQDILSSKSPNVPIIGPTGNKDSDDGYIGKFSPSYIKCNEKILDHKLKIEGSKRLSFFTDVENDYFIRDDNRGELLFLVNGEVSKEITQKFSISKFLTNGALKIALRPSMNHIHIGDSFTFAVGLKDDAMSNRVVTKNSITILIIAGSAKTPNPQDRRNNKPQKKESKYLGLPGFELLTKKQKTLKLFAKDIKTITWEDSSFSCNEIDGGMIKDLGNGGYIHHINLDNIYLLNYCRKKANNPTAINEIMSKYILAMRIMMLGIESGLQAPKIKNSNQDLREDNYDVFRRRASAGAASVVLTLCENLPKQFSQQDEEYD